MVKRISTVMLVMFVGVLLVGCRSNNNAKFESSTVKSQMKDNSRSNDTTGNNSEVKRTETPTNKGQMTKLIKTGLVSKKLDSKVKKMTVTGDFNTKLPVAIVTVYLNVNNSDVAKNVVKATFDSLTNLDDARKLNSVKIIIYDKRSGSDAYLKTCYYTFSGELIWQYKNTPIKISDMKYEARELWNR